MKRIIFLRVSVLVCFQWANQSVFQLPAFNFQLSSLRAQTFTEHLTRSNTGEGLVILHHDAEIEALVNGVTRFATTNTASLQQNAASMVPVIQHPSDSLFAGDSSSALQLPLQGHRTRSMGYRIQIYAGGNNRQAKAEAYRQAGLVRSMFSDVSVYTNFISPRWTCRVGDFKTREEAVEMLNRLRETQKFREASIVKSQIVVIY